MSQDRKSETIRDVIFTALVVLVILPLPITAFLLHSAACDQGNRHIDQWARRGFPEGDQTTLQYRYCQIVRRPIHWVSP